MARLIYNRRGWWRVWDIATGTRVFGTEDVIPDQYGCTMRRMIFGPYSDAKAALGNDIGRDSTG